MLLYYPRTRCFPLLYDEAWRNSCHAATSYRMACHLQRPILVTVSWLSIGSMVKPTLRSCRKVAVSLPSRICARVAWGCNASCRRRSSFNLAQTRTSKLNTSASAWERSNRNTRMNRRMQNLPPAGACCPSCACSARQAVDHDQLSKLSDLLLHMPAIFPCHLLPFRASCLHTAAGTIAVVHSVCGDIAGYPRNPTTLRLLELRQDVDFEGTERGVHEPP